MSCHQRLNLEQNRLYRTDHFCRALHRISQIRTKFTLHSRHEWSSFESSGRPRPQRYLSSCTSKYRWTPVPSKKLRTKVDEDPPFEGSRLNGPSTVHTVHPYLFFSGYGIDRSSEPVYERGRGQMWRNPSPSRYSTVASKADGKEGSFDQREGHESIRHSKSHFHQDFQRGWRPMSKAGF